jgi:hypothetical protein
MKDPNRIFREEGQLVDEALKRSMCEALLRHQERADPVVIARDGKIVCDLQMARADSARSQGTSCRLMPNRDRPARLADAHATLVTTFPVARPDSEYASASRTFSNENTQSTSGLMAPLSTSRVISPSCPPSARTKRYGPIWIRSRPRP